MENQGTANIESFYVRTNCYKENLKSMTISQIIKDAEQKIIKQGKRSEDLSKLIKDKVSKKIVDPYNCQHFHAKFIGCVCSNKTARVLVTSANFTNYHFEYPSLESVVCHEIKEDEFMERFISPLKM